MRPSAAMRRFVDSNELGVFTMADKPKEFQTTVAIEELEAADFELHYSYGRFMHAWASLEAKLYAWFAGISRMQDAMARAIFYGARGFNARAELLEAVIPHATKQTPLQIQFIKEAVKKPRMYVGFRNKVAHGEPQLKLSPDVRVRMGIAADYRITQGKDYFSPQEPPITMESLAVATANIDALKVCVFHMIPRYRDATSPTPEECLARVLALPNEPNTKSDQSSSKSGPADQGARHRNKKAFRAAQARRPETRK